MAETENASAEYRQVARIVTEAAHGITGTVHRMHRAIARRPFTALGAAATPARLLHSGIAELTYTSVRGGITAAAAIADVAADVFGKTRPRGSLHDSPAGATVSGIIAGAFGHRAYTQDSGMTVRAPGGPVPITRGALRSTYPAASGHIVLFLHGLIETEAWWRPRVAADGTPARLDFGTRLTADLGCTPVYLRYPTGHRIWRNGQELDALLSQLVDAWPVPIERISIVGHSMGGLVARSAVHTASRERSQWLGALTDVVCLGTPHNGAPLELGAHMLSWTLRRFPESAPLGDLLDMRSDGIKDLRHGHLHPEQESALRPDSLFVRGPRIDTLVPGGTRQYFLTATIARRQDGLLARFLGDALVTPASAGDSTQNASRHWCGGKHHFDLLTHDEVYAKIRDWLSAGTETSQVAPTTDSSGSTSLRQRPFP